MKNPKINLILFLLTLITTLLAGTYLSGYDPFKQPISIIRGVPFSFTLLFILLAHEMGHYYFARKYGVSVSLPYFMPGLFLPPPFLSIGTFGAFISIKSKIPDKNSLFDIGVAGPLASFVFSVIAVYVGLKLSYVLPYVVNTNGINLGENLILKIFSHLIYGVSSDKITIILHPFALAGWFGFLVTMLNLIPVGQLDGGHILYAVLGRKHILVSKIIVIFLIILGYFTWSGWFFWAFLLIIIGANHPNTSFDNIELSKSRKVLSLIMLLIFILIFFPEPFFVEF